MLFPAPHENEHPHYSSKELLVIRNSKFYANTGLLRELSQITLIFAQMHKRLLTKWKHFSLYSRSVSTFLLILPRLVPPEGEKGLRGTMKFGRECSSTFEDAG